MEGRLYVYDAESKYTAFESNASGSNRVAIFIPGLTDGPLSLPYLPLLAATLSAHAFSVVQPILPSSYTQYGTSSLRNDAVYIDKLVAHLVHQRGGRALQLVLIGHSTGCQNIIHFLKTARLDVARMVVAIVLQAAVSDREYMMWRDAPKTSRLIEAAKALHPDDLLPRDADLSPITASRYLSLATRLGDDDMFSSDLTDDELKSVFSGVRKGMVVGIFLSGADEYVPSHVDVNFLIQRWRNVLVKQQAFAVTAKVIDKADHALSDSKVQENFCSGVDDIIQKALTKGSY
ncbi:hypothetical protein SeMB42_g00928 [Synchytrium endobioticum]|uniref:AB hydrolase-1 domain-containing protein n=1 Tax=Synchytrium endobioticum TaxID=286115 RepID=A0A507CT72_9FUNG|nr:hypothetical protein SeLEV6574_g05667 [Synchytrium endobioticum]TPX53230.1 hypothetical protein SeMB42_g00928 [Synchytrium endobioticum]